MSILVTAIRSGNLDVVKEKFSRPVSKLTQSILNFIQLSFDSLDFEPGASTYSV